MGTGCPGGVGSVKCVISTATAGAQRGEERHGKRRWVGWEKHDPSLLYRQSLWGRGQENCDWGKGDRRGFCALAGRGCPLVLEFPWCYLCLRLMVKLAGLLRALGSATQGLILSSELPAVVAVFLGGAESCRNQWCHSYSTAMLIPFLWILQI